jgi:hypothetical protein
MGLLIPAVYRHTQDVASDTWTIVHNLGSNGGQGLPIVDVAIDVNGTPSKIIPADVTKVDANTVVVTFGSALAGSAIVIV